MTNLCTLQVTVKTLKEVTVDHLFNARSLLRQARCLKIRKSEASYVYILSEISSLKKPKKSQFWQVFENLKFAVKQCYQTGQF